MDQTKISDKLAKTITPDNRPTGKLILSPRPRKQFSLEDDEPSDHLHNPLFFSYDLEAIKAELKRFEDQEHAKPTEERVNYYSERLIEQIKLLESIKEPYGLEDLCYRYEGGMRLESELVYQLARCREGNQAAFESLSQKTYESFWQIKQMARKRDPVAILALAQIAYEATEVLADLGKSKPELLKPAAEEKHKWPMFRSKHKQFQSVEDDDEQSYFRKIGLGEKSPLKLEPGKRYDPELPATIIAMRLKDYVQSVRSMGREHFAKNRKAKDPFIRYLGEHTPPWASDLPDIIRTEAIVQDDWWKIAKAFLKESYPCLVEATTEQSVDQLPPMLKEIVPDTEKNDERRVIFKKIEAKFLQLLKDQPRPTLQPIKPVTTT
jgi:hypothetical protein